MNNNPVMQRVTMLTEMWREALVANKDVRVFNWVGTSSVDYRMIRGFVMFHASEKSNLSDVFFSLNQPYEAETAAIYGEKLISDMAGFLAAWNDDEDLVEKTGRIDWMPFEKAANVSDEDYFVQNINKLATSIGVSGKPDVLAVALLPQAVSDYGAFAQFIAKCINAEISEKVRFMVFDTYEMKAFKELEEHTAEYFLSLYPDMDMPGAMNQILETAKAQKKNPEERDAVAYQQALLKMNESIGYDHQKNVEVYKVECLQIAAKNNWPHLEALVYFFLHSYFGSQNRFAEALLSIDIAIEKSDLAIEKKTTEPGALKYQYRIAKGNLFFMHKKYQDAINMYKECLLLDHAAVDKLVLLGIYQMLGNSVKNAFTYSAAWPHFEEGWLLLKDEDDEVIKKNAVIMFYAKDMMEASSGRNENTDTYKATMDRWWGKDWMQRLNRNEYNPILG